ncbi:Uncharacterised protein [Serratia liquefaciens]|uniref:DUF6616 family protein n=1 Tax=Serratia liquefaciens TaxID=614 RepID=UPI002183ABB2|nr:DUF6616 family protein [Serratia liquefaciens]CAI2538033.1 Uncharacterised protein [Serratia liquefaciens]
MSHYLIELYSPNTRWGALSTTERQQFVDNVQLAMGSLSHLGVEILALSETDSTIDKSTNHSFLGIWRFADIQTRDMLLAGIKASGWYNYFDHINAAGSDTAFENHLITLAAG